MRVFVGGSTEANNAVETLSEWIEADGHKPVLWTDHEVFPLGGYTFKSLQVVARKVDAAIFVFAEDDMIRSRNRTTTIPRDNVLIEYGLFTGVLGDARVAYCLDGDPKQPSDLLGINRIELSNKSRARVLLRRWLEQVSEATIAANPPQVSHALCLDYQETRPSIDSLEELLTSAREFIDWYTLNFGNTRVSGIWRRIEKILLDRVRAGVRVRVLILHPAAYLPVHLEIALLKHAGSGSITVQDVRKRCLRAVRDLRELRSKAETLAARARHGSLDVRCTRAAPTFGTITTEQCMKLEFYPVDWKVPTTDRCTVTVKAPLVDPRLSCWHRDFSDLWSNAANLAEDLWLQGFTPTKAFSRLTCDLSNHTLAESRLREVSSLIERREELLCKLINASHTEG